MIGVHLGWWAGAVASVCEQDAGVPYGSSARKKDCPQRFIALTCGRPTPGASRNRQAVSRSLQGAKGTLLAALLAAFPLPFHFLSTAFAWDGVECHISRSHSPNLAHIPLDWRLRQASWLSRWVDWHRNRTCCAAAGLQTKYCGAHEGGEGRCCAHQLAAEDLGGPPPWHLRYHVCGPQRRVTAHNSRLARPSAAPRNRGRIRRTTAATAAALAAAAL